MASLYSIRYGFRTVRRDADRIVCTVMDSILDRIGNTSLLGLRNSNIFLKLENENPTGSMKDRMALAMIVAAEADGRLKPGGSVVEYTGGSTGVSIIASA